MPNIHKLNIYALCVSCSVPPAACWSATQHVRSSSVRVYGDDVSQIHVHVVQLWHRIIWVIDDSVCKSYAKPSFCCESVNEGTFCLEHLYAHACNSGVGNKSLISFGGLNVRTFWVALRKIRRRPRRRRHVLGLFARFIHPYADYTTMRMNGRFIGCCGWCLCCRMRVSTRGTRTRERNFSFVFSFVSWKQLNYNKLKLLFFLFLHLATESVCCKNIVFTVYHLCFASAWAIS